MFKYELALIVDGDLGEVDARESISNLVKLFENLPDFEEKIVWKDELAYPIKKKKIGHRFTFNFSLEDKKILNEFNRLALVNNSVLRFLVINLEKDYGYRNKQNEKKIKDSQIKQEKYKKYLEYKSKTANMNTSNAT